MFFILRLLQTPLSGFPVGYPTDFAKQLAFPAGHDKHCPHIFKAVHQAWKDEITQQWPQTQVELFATTAPIWVFDGSHRFEVSLRFALLSGFQPFN
jgi:hypothetical protein